MGIISPVGNRLEEAWSNVCEGVSGIQLVDDFDTNSFSTRIGGMVRAFLTSEPLDIELASAADVYRAGGADFAAEITEALKRAAGIDGDAVRLNSWGTASVVYEITN